MAPSHLRACLYLDTECTNHVDYSLASPNKGPNILLGHIVDKMLCCMILIILYDGQCLWLLKHWPLVCSIRLASAGYWALGFERGAPGRAGQGRAGQR